MKLFLQTYILIISTTIVAQTAFHNFGNVQMHENTNIGFHTNLINDGVFSQNLGLAGFYNTEHALSISGSQIPRFFNMETAVDNHLYLEVNTEIQNQLSYIIGDIITPRQTPSISLDFLANAVPLLENDFRLTDGYASVRGNNTFTFPIGDDDKYLPLIIPNQTTNPFFRAAYFNEDPNFPSTFPTSFNTNITETIIDNVSNDEFWDFKGRAETFVTLTWNNESNIGDLVSDLNNLRVVGWSIAENRWEDLGNVLFTGDLTQGTITSVSFAPNDYEIITFGALIGSDGIEVYNVITPNDDGVNDVFVIEGVELFPNTLEIYNRWGILVYQAVNYQNDWDGLSNGRTNVNVQDRLPTGTYYYVLRFTEDNRNYASYLYIKN